MPKPKIGAITQASSGLARFLPAAPKEAPPLPAVVADDTRSAGRPKSLPDDVKSVTFRMSDEAHKALKTVAAQEGTTTKAIILAGLADQFSRRGLSVKVI